MLPHFQLLPDQQVNQRAEEVGFARAIFSLHPKSLALVVDNTVEDTLEMGTDRGREIVLRNRLHGLFLLNDNR